MKPKRKPKRHGETYAQQLARERAEKQAYGYEVGMEVGKTVRQQTAQDLMKMFVIAANNKWGIGNKRMREFTDEVYKVSCEFDALAGEENDLDYARDVMDRRIQQIFGDEPVEFRLKY